MIRNIPMKKTSRYESRVKINAIIIFLLATLLGVGMIYYISGLKKSINNQEDNINKNEKLLSLINNLIENVNNAQSYSNIYTVTTDENYLNNFNISIQKIEMINDSIIYFYGDNFNKDLLMDVKDLLIKKEQILKDINNQLASFNPYHEIYSIVENYHPEPKESSVCTTINDTIIYKTERKGFFQRLGEVFSPSNLSDSLVLVTKTTIDTISNTDSDTDELLNEIQLYTEKGRSDYIKQINTVETKYNNLILSDRQISQEISDLLIILHKHTLDSVVTEIKKSELLINKNINLSILFSIIALLIILAFIFLIFYDIKKVVAARKATEEAKMRTEEIMQSRHKLLLSVSHDVKAPLSSILGYLELMQMSDDDNSDKPKILSMKSSAEHILSLLTNLLNFSRLDQGKESVILSDFNIKKLCDELDSMFKPLSSNKHLEFVYNNDLDVDTCVKSDALKIKQILSNLLSNAIKYTMKGKVTFAVNKGDGELVFTIIDEGIGIQEEKLKEIYKPFNRIDNNESLIEGNGFGLFVVKGLVDLLQGEIDVTSELNVGSCFTVKIPVDFVDPIEETDDVVDLTGINMTGGQNILVVDDDNTLLTVIESMINKIGCNCFICHSLIEFEDELKNINDYDVVLTDREMGAFSGMDVLRKIKEIDTGKRVVLMTARSEYNEEVAMNDGFDGYLRKPFSIKDIMDILKINLNLNSESKSISKYNGDFPELCLMFDNDLESIENILNVFVNTTSENILRFNEIIEENNFAEAAALCHKMCPMFVQLEQKESAEFLYKMDKLRGADEESFPEWKSESLKFINNADDFISYLYEKYNL